jgi:hypothetical protein
VATLGGPPWVHLELSCVAPAHRRELRMICDGGVAILDGGWAEEVIVTPEGGPQERRPIPGELPLLSELSAFAAHLRGGRPPKSDAREGAAIVRCITQLGELSDARDRGAAKV